MDVLHIENLIIDNNYGCVSVFSKQSTVCWRHFHCHTLVGEQPLSTGDGIDSVC